MSEKQSRRRRRDSANRLLYSGLQLWLLFAVVPCQKEKNIKQEHFRFVPLLTEGTFKWILRLRSILSNHDSNVLEGAKLGLTEAHVYTNVGRQSVVYL